MLKCIEPELQSKVQTLQEMSGLSDFSLKSQIRHYTQLHNGRIPNLDELDGCDSRPYLTKQYGIVNGKSNKIEVIADKVLGKGVYSKEDPDSTISDITHKLNNTFTDLILIPHKYGKRLAFEIQRRPTIDYTEPTDKFKLEGDRFDGTILNSILSKLNDLYGIKVNIFTPGNNALLQELRQKTGNSKYSLAGVNGFIYNGEIYISSKLTEENANKTKVHELLHLIVGSIKFTNPSVYNNLVNLASSFQNQFQNFVNKEFGKPINLQTLPTLSDYQEEFMVEELAKYLTDNKNSILNKTKDNDLKYQVLYNMNRVLDTAFMGDYSVKSIPPNDLYNMSLSNVMDIINSVYTKNLNFKNLTHQAEQHRILANLKKQLADSKDNTNKLTLECN